MIGGQVGIVGHIKIADGVKIAAQSGIGHTIKEENSIVQGSPAISIGDYKRSYVLFRRLPELTEKIDALEKELANLKSHSNK
jgi:UDP-3-O-[3-hydroxymyristoyl] glucosamine N-acyltransferase